MRLSLLALALFAAPVFAQSNADSYRPGDVDASAVQPYEAQYRIFVIQGAGSGMPFGTMSESLSIEDGVALSTVHVNGAGQTQRDSAWFSWPEMEPIRFRSEANGAVKELAFDGLAVSGTLRDGSALDVTLDAAAFGQGVADIIARTLPMEDGATASFYAFDDDTEDYVSTTTLTVGAVEQVLGREARVITSESPSNSVTMWYDAEADQMLQVAFSPQPGITVELRRSDLD